MIIERTRKIKAEAISFNAAQASIMGCIVPIERKEIIPIAVASGRVLTQDIIASSSIPRFSRAAMDGYAVKSVDVTSASPENPAILYLSGSVYASCVPTQELSSGECIAITTGSMMPDEADAVVRIEDTAVDNHLVMITAPVSAGGYVALAGSDIKQGELLLKEGTVLDPGKIGILASQGISNIEVYAKPHIAIISTGDELAAVGSELKPGQIYDINSNTLSALISQNGGIPLNFPVIGDDPRKLIKALNDASTADAIVISGGSSVGEKDLMLDVLKIMGEVVFSRIRIKPGPPTAFAMIHGKPVFGMPGPPTACLMNSYLLLVPALRKMARLPKDRQRPLKAKLLKQATVKCDTTKSFSVQLVGDMVLPVFKKAGDIACTGKADGYILVQENTDADKDTDVLVTLF